MRPKKWGNLCLSKQACAYGLGTLEIILFWQDCMLEEKNIIISYAHHTRKCPWWLSPKKMRRMRHAPTPAFPAQKSSLLPSAYVLSPAASSSSPCPFPLHRFLLFLPITKLWFRSGTYSQMLRFFSLKRAPSQLALSPPLAVSETLIPTPSLLLSFQRSRWLLGGMCLLMHLKEQKSIKTRQSLSKSYSALVQNSYLMWGLS